MSILMPVLAFGDELDKTPSWYNGDKPWASIGRAERKKIILMHGGFEVAQKEASKPATAAVPRDLANAGEALINRIVKDYRLDPSYKNPSLFGPRMAIWLPEKAWARLSEKEKESVVAFMKGRWKNWAVGVGPIRGRDVICDRIVLQP